MIRRGAPLVGALACTVALLIALPAAGASPTEEVTGTDQVSRPALAETSP